MGYYDDIAKGYDELHGEEQLKKLEMVRGQLNELKWIIDKDTILLDVGCGTGISTDFWNCDATGVDPSAGLIAQNKAKKSKLIVCSAENLPFDDRSFDIVISLTAIQNFNDIEQGLKEIERVGNGKYILTFLKRSDKADMIVELIKKKFKIVDIVEEEKDIIFFAESFL